MTPTSIYVEPTGTRIAPFDDPIGEVPIANRPLCAWQDEMIRDAGLVRIPELRPPCVVVPDNLFATGAVLSRLVEGAAGRNAVLVLGDSLFGRSTTPVQPGVEAIPGGWRFSAVRFVSGGSDVPVDVVIDPEEAHIPLGLPAAFGDPEAKAALPRHPVMTLHHWVHILWANQAAAASIARRTPTGRMALRALWALLRALSPNKWRFLGKLNTIGKRCDIHPTAVIEGSTLGDGVEVGPFARILFSRIGDGAKIMTAAEVVASTIGAGAAVAQHGCIRLCVLYPEAFAAQYLMQACVLGRRSITSGAGFSMDVNFERNIRVQLGGRLWDTGTKMLGSAFGHHTRIGTGFWLAAGRAIPNGTFLIRDPREVIARVPTAPGDGRALFLRDGVLVALEGTGSGPGTGSD